MRLSRHLCVRGKVCALSSAMTVRGRRAGKCRLIRSYKTRSRVDRRGNPGHSRWRHSAEGVGFEPTVGLHLLRFSRPSQSTTLAPLRVGRKTNAVISHRLDPSRHLLLTDLVQDVVGDEDRHIDGHRQRDRVTRP